MTLDLVCHVVDNYGDIAVVWRLAQALRQDAGSPLNIRILLDDLAALEALVPRANWGDVTVLDSARLPDAEPADVLVEAFGSPTPPAWLEAFYAAGAQKRRVFVHLEYLTAEAWSLEYHRSPSPVGRPGIERYFFVPSFRPGAGGLIFTDPAPTPLARGSEDWLMTIFSYEHDFTNFWTDLGPFLEERNQTARVLVFAGRSRAGALGSWERVRDGLPGAGRITVVDHPFVSQDEYTALLAAGDFHVVRGEESWTQAVMAGRPFLWHAYLQPEGHQRVKVDAFLEVWRDRFAAEGEAGLAVWERWSSEFRRFNDREQNSDADRPLEHYRVFWENAALGRRVGEKWAAELRKNAKLSRKMLEFLESLRL